MPGWLEEFLYILSISKKTQWAIVFGVIFFVGIHLLGNYMLSNFELKGQVSGIQDVIVQQFAKKYDKVALGALISFWMLAYKSYLRDKKRFW